MIVDSLSTRKRLHSTSTDKIEPKSIPNSRTMQKETERQLPAEKGIGTNPESQYLVKRVEVFEDELAYSHLRGIYEIMDKKTGKKYLGISGIGITEVGSDGDGRIEN